MPKMNSQIKIMINEIETIKIKIIINNATTISIFDTFFKFVPPYIILC